MSTPSDRTSFPQFLFFFLHVHKLILVPINKNKKKGESIDIYCCQKPQQKDHDTAPSPEIWSCPVSAEGDQDADRDLSGSEFGPKVLCSSKIK